MRQYVADMRVQADDQPFPRFILAAMRKKMNGPITVRVGSGFAGVVSFGTSNGALNVRDHAGNISSRSISRNKGRIEVGEGGAPSRLATSNGTIRFTISG